MRAVSQQATIGKRYERGRYFETYPCAAARMTASRMLKIFIEGRILFGQCRAMRLIWRCESIEAQGCRCIYPDVFAIPSPLRLVRQYSRGRASAEGGLMNLAFEEKIW